MKKILATLVAFSFIIAGVSAVDAAVPSVGDPGRFWSIPDDAQRGDVVMQFLDSSPGERGSYLLPNQGFARYNDADPTCANLEDPKCSSGGVIYQAVVPFCTGPSEVNCTEEVGIVDESGKKTPAQFDRYFPLKAQNQFVGDPLRKLPSGVAGSLFTLPAAAHDGGNSYHLSVQMNGGGSNLNSIQMGDFSVQLSPVKLEDISSLCGIKSVCFDSGWSKLPAGSLGNTADKETWVNQGPGLSGSNYCVATSAAEKLCAQRYAFPAGFKFYVKVRAVQLPAGWMHGRIAEPDIQIKELAGLSTIEMQGVPIAVPAIYKMYRYLDMPVTLKDQYDVTTGAYKLDPNFLNNPSNYFQGGRTPELSIDPLLRNNIYEPTPFSKAGMDQLKLWLPFVEDKATASLSFWSVRTLSAAEMEGSSKCYQDSKSVTGIVSTNATQYSAGPPTLDKTEETLNYQVAAPHYSPDKSEFKGSYDLVIRSDVARCIYGFSKAPISATIAITSSDGLPQIATTVIGEKDGWVYLRAKNFGFSAPIIKAKLTQEAEVIVTPTPTPTPTATKKPVVKKVTITCIKGKTSKKVTAVKPKCPTGFKKK